jgi:hypothetical protein
VINAHRVTLLEANITDTHHWPTKVAVVPRSAVPSLHTGDANITGNDLAHGKDREGVSIHLAVTLCATSGRAANQPDLLKY